MTTPDAEATWRAEAAEKITVTEDGSTTKVLVGGYTLAEFLTWAALVTEADAAAAAGDYAERVREAYVALAAGAAHAVRTPVGAARAEQPDPDDRRLVVDGKPIVRVIIDVRVSPSADPDALARIGDVLAERLYDSLDDVLGATPLMGRYDVEPWWVRPDHAPQDDGEAGRG